MTNEASASVLTEGQHQQVAKMLIALDAAAKKAIEQLRSGPSVEWVTVISKFGC